MLLNMWTRTQSTWYQKTKLDKEEQEKVGRVNGWFEFITNNGTLSFGAVFGDKDMYADEFWADTENKADDFNVNNIFRPTSRTPEAWIKSGCDGLLGKTLKCVATREYNSRGFDAKARAFVVVDWRMDAIWGQRGEILSVPLIIFCNL